MTDVDEKTGLAACAELQKEYSTKNVTFTRCDVTKPDELVSHGSTYIMDKSTGYSPPHPS